MNLHLVNATLRNWTDQSWSKLALALFLFRSVSWVDQRLQCAGERHGSANRPSRDHGQRRPQPTKFYAQLFNWKVGEPGGPELGFYAQVPGDSTGTPVGIGQEPSGRARTTAYVQVPDLQATLDQAVALGGKVVVPPTEIPGVVTFAQFTDPEGNVIGLTKG